MGSLSSAKSDSWPIRLSVTAEKPTNGRTAVAVIAAHTCGRLIQCPSRVDSVSASNLLHLSGVLRSIWSREAMGDRTGRGTSLRHASHAIALGMRGPILPRSKSIVRWCGLASTSESGILPGHLSTVWFLRHNGTRLGGASLRGTRFFGAEDFQKHSLLRNSSRRRNSACVALGGTSWRSRAYKLPSHCLAELSRRPPRKRLLFGARCVYPARTMTSESRTIESVRLHLR